jgi:multicomponent K+:H+ antiporter subunit E
VRPRWLHPVLGPTVALTWLALANSVAPAQLLLALVLGLAVPPLLARFSPPPPRLRAPGVALGLAARVLGDIVVANLQVAVLILGPERRLRPGFVQVPVDLDVPLARAILAGIITLTPGTLSVDLADDGRTLLVHALDVPDPEALVATIRARYAAPLARILAPAGERP